MRVFVGYKCADDERAHWVANLASDLELAGFDVALDLWDVRFGDSFVDFMARGVGEAEVVLFIVTDDFVGAVEGLESGSAKFEIELATARSLSGDRVRVIPVLRQGQRVPAHLRGRRYVDFRDDKKYACVLAKLVIDLKQRARYPRVFNWYPRNLPPLLPLNTFMSEVVGPFYGLKWDNEALWHGRRSQESHLGLLGTWTGATGSFHLTREGDVVEGVYDWGDRRSIGRVQGRLEGSVLYFNWRWADDSKSGNGFFLCGESLYGSPFADVREYLIGGWFFADQRVPLRRAIYDSSTIQVRPWVFFRESDRCRYVGQR